MKTLNRWKQLGDSYDIYVKIATIIWASTTSYTTPNLDNCTQYTVQVFAIRTGYGNGPPSDQAPGTPTGIP